MHTFHSPDPGLATVGFLGGRGETRRGGCLLGLWWTWPDEYQNDKFSFTVPRARCEGTSHIIPVLGNCEEPNPVPRVLPDPRPNPPPWKSTTQKQTRPKHTACSHAQCPNCYVSQHSLSSHQTEVEDPALGREFTADSLGTSPLGPSLLTWAAEKMSLLGWVRS